MIEQVFHYSLGDAKSIEKVIFDENLHYIHMVFPKGEGAPEHYTNGNVYMTVLRGVLSLKLGEQEARDYTRGSIIKIPHNVKMLIKNPYEAVLELIIVKAPAPEVK